MELPVEPPLKRRALSALRDHEAALVLAPEEVERYHREGWLVPKVSLSKEKLERYQKTLDRVIAENPTVRPELLVSAHVETKTKEGVVGNYDFLALAQEPMILEAVGQVLGSDFALWGCQIFCKPGKDGMEVPMHQADGEYWPIRPLATVTVWVALDRSDKGNGCLNGRMVLSQRLTADELSRLEAPVDVELDAGQMSMHDVYLVHGSNANGSGRRRAGVAFRYMPTSSLFDREMYDSDRAGFTIDWKKRSGRGRRGRPLFLLSGQDLSGGRNSYSPLPAPLAWPEGFQRLGKSDESQPSDDGRPGRRVAQWGVRYDYTTQSVDLTPVLPIPPVLREIFPEVGAEFTQCIINEYGAQDAIPWHLDDLAFGPTVRVFVFGDPRPLLLRPLDGDGGTKTVEMRHLWSYSFSGPARYQPLGWQDMEEYKHLRREEREKAYNARQESSRILSQKAVMGGGEIILLTRRCQLPSTRRPIWDGRRDASQDGLDPFTKQKLLLDAKSLDLGPLLGVVGSPVSDQQRDEFVEKKVKEVEPKIHRRLFRRAERTYEVSLDFATSFETDLLAVWCSAAEELLVKRCMDPIHQNFKKLTSEMEEFNRRPKKRKDRPSWTELGKVNSRT
eukprot:g7316.t1